MVVAVGCCTTGGRLWPRGGLGGPLSGKNLPMSPDWNRANSRFIMTSICFMSGWSTLAGWAIDTVARRVTDTFVAGPLDSDIQRSIESVLPPLVKLFAGGQYSSPQGKSLTVAQDALIPCFWSPTNTLVRKGQEARERTWRLPDPHLSIHIPIGSVREQVFTLKRTRITNYWYGSRVRKTVLLTD